MFYYIIFKSFFKEEKDKSKMPPMHYNWMVCCFWFLDYSLIFCGYNWMRLLRRRAPRNDKKEIGHSNDKRKSSLVITKRGKNSSTIFPFFQSCKLLSMSWSHTSFKPVIKYWFSLKLLQLYSQGLFHKTLHFLHSNQGF